MKQQQRKTIFYWTDEDDSLTIGNVVKFSANFRRRSIDAFKTFA